MRKFFNIVPIFFLIVGFFTSCNDWLDVQPESQQREKDLFKTYVGFKSSLSGCYSTMASRELYGEKLTISDIEYLACLWNKPNANYNVVGFFLYNHQYNNVDIDNEIKYIYGALFNVIVQANKIIEHSNDAKHAIYDEKSRNVVLGEAYALRAYCHFDTLRLFGQIPQNATKKVMLPYSLASGINYVAPYLEFSQFVDQLEKDIEQAEKLLDGSDPIQQYDYDGLNKMGRNPVSLDDDFMQFRQFRLNYFAVRAMKARLFLYIGQNEKAYQEAKYIIDAKVNGKPFMKLSGNEDIARNLYNLPNECIFALSNHIIPEYVPDLLLGYNGKVNMERDCVITLSMLNNVLYENANTTSDNRYLKVWDKMSTDVTGQKTPTLLKYSYPIKEYESAGRRSELITKLQFMPLIRLSEIYLIAMETTQDLAEANTLYKTYMKSHNVNITEGFSSLNDLRHEVMKDYHREFYAEGVMFYTYKRMAAKQLMFNRNPMAEEDYILPLPTTEANPNVKLSK